MNEKKVLIADDIRLMQKMLCGYVKELGYKDVTLAKNGKEAVFLYQSKKIDIALLDIDMPELSGLEALKQIKAYDPDAYVVMVSGVSTIENVEVAMAAGANGFIVKPYSPKKIIDALKNHEQKDPKIETKQKELQSKFSAKVEEREVERQKIAEAKRKENEKQLAEARDDFLNELKTYEVD